MLVGPGAQLAAAQPSDPGPGGANIASESPANRAIGGDDLARLELKLGSTGQAVAAVQRRLDLKATGYFGAETELEVRYFQQDEGLEDDGIVGKQTWKALFSGGASHASVAAGGSSTPNLLPAVNTQQGGAEFAVRGASESELKKLGVNEADVGGPQGKNSGLAAIEIRTPETGGGSSVEGGGSSVESSLRAASAGGSQEAGSHGASGEGAASNTSSNGGTPQAGTQARTPSGSGGTTQPSNGSTPRAPDTNPLTSGTCAETLRWPVSSRGISSPFGPRGGRLHAGIDIPSPVGTAVRASACGVITYRSWASGYGNYVCIKHSSQLTTCYAHLRDFANVRLGQYVTTGQIIGHVGMTGNTTGPHLHYEVRTGLWGTPLNPLNYLGKAIPGTPVNIGGPDLVLDEQSASETSAGSESVEKASATNSALSAGSQPGAEDSSTDLSSDASLRAETKSEAPEDGPSDNASPVAQEATGGSGSESSAAGQGGGPSDNASEVAKEKVHG